MLSFNQRRSLPCVLGCRAYDTHYGIAIWVAWYRFARLPFLAIATYVCVYLVKNTPRTRGQRTRRYARRGSRLRLTAGKIDLCCGRRSLGDRAHETAHRAASVLLPALMQLLESLQAIASRLRSAPS